MKKTFFIFAFLFSLPVFAQDSEYMLTAEEILAGAHDDYPTECATEAFANALYDNMDQISKNASEMEVRAWAKTMMFDETVLEEVLECPEIESITDRLKTIAFTPIVFRFDNGREITINYTTQLKVLDQKLMLARKPSLPNGDPNPKLMDENDPAIYINTDPAWYGIMVVERGSLGDYVGTGKNNTLSVKWIEDNIDDVYPKGGSRCTNKSALAYDEATINQVLHKLTDVEDDSNDYYVAGDVNLEWIMYAEIALDIAITIVTLGAGEVVMVGAKSARAVKTGKTLAKSMRALTQMDDVKKYIKVVKQITTHTDDIAKMNRNIQNAKKYERAMKRADKARKAGQDASKYERQAENILKDAKKIDKNITADDLKDADKLAEKYKGEQKRLQDEIKELEKDAKKMENESKNVREYKQAAQTFSDLQAYYKSLRAFTRPQTGNFLTKNLKKVKAAAKTAHAANNGAKLMTKAGRLGRAGMSSRSAKIGDWLFDSTLKHGARLGRVVRDFGGVYAIISFMGDMYDKTSDTSDQYSNGIDFKPLCLLSADDLEGQENEVNYGMWLMWVGNSTDPADDDAAYLQAMDFATKFHYMLNEFQDENGRNCNVDIYVVRPIIRIDESDPTETSGEIFYLFMNEIPWSTN